MPMPDRTSRLPGFHALSPADRLAAVAAFAGLPPETTARLGAGGGLPLAQADRMVENVISTMAVPLGIATNFLIDGREVLVPMATEEASVIAAASNAARMCRATGGIRTSTSGPLMMAQIQALGMSDPWAARGRILERREEIAALCDAADPKLVAAGGGFRDLVVRVIDTAGGPMVVTHIVVDTRDAMGANAVNTMAEALAPRLAEWSGGRVSLRIVTNLADRRLARARTLWPAEAIGGREVAEAIVAAWHFALADPYRAATHNKGVMNGVSAVVLATGNDTRAVEAGAHAYAALGGQYRPLARYELAADGGVAGSLEMPLAVGIVGGATRVHPTAQACLRILGVSTADALARVAVSVGLVQQFAALRALTTEGIQKGHMKLHAQNVAMQAGATGDEIALVAKAMVARGAVRQDVAEEELRKLRGQAP
ncbi:MAG: hydroxymethylglutaryl-CoA reductase, degradative [Rhodospirillaceae bacterium]|nr:hydroxymethylglutaryl-CoA reductase, degradative [Rhodospirillaceae bacterium]